MPKKTLDDKQISNLIKLREANISTQDIAERYNVTDRTVRRWFEKIDNDKSCPTPENMSAQCAKRKRVRITSPLSPIQDSQPAENLKRIMEEEEISIDDIASCTGLSRSCVDNLVKGVRTGNLATWIAIARSLKMSVSELIGE